MTLTEQGRQRVAEIAQRHGFSFEAAEVLLAALIRGNGAQAQFAHPELGGMGQWSAGGMIMIGDMFNNALKSRVDGLATELAALVGSASLLQPQAAAEGGLFASSPSIWPAQLGAPSASGSQNDLRYAVFPAHRRLAVMRGERLFLYDTGDRLIGGVSQQQGGGETLSFSSQDGPVSLTDLVQILDEDSLAPAQPPAAAPAPAPQPAAPAQSAAPQADPEEAAIFRKIEQLHGLFSRGVLTQTEFEAKKAELLSRL